MNETTTSTRSVALRIKECRTRQGLSQEALANELGYKDRSMIAKIEAGRVDLPTTKLMQIANVFDMPIDYFLGHQEKPWHPSVLDDYHAARSFSEKYQIVETNGCVDPSVAYDFYSGLRANSIPIRKRETGQIPADEMLPSFKRDLIEYAKALSEDQAARALQVLKLILENGK